MTAAKRPIDPDELAPAIGFAHGWLVEANGTRTLWLAGQCAHDREGRIVGRDDLVAQVDRALENVGIVLRSAGMEFTDIVQLDLYVTSRNDYAAARRELGKAWQRRCGKHYPAMALFEVRSLFDPQAKVEIQGVAVR